MSNLPSYNRLSYTTFSIAYENCNRGCTESDIDEFIDLVKMCKKNCHWSIACGKLSNFGYSNVVNESLQLI